jgi:hypothetical protein
MHRLSAVCAALAAACTSCSSSSPSAAGPAVHDAGVPDEGSTPGDDGSAMTFSGDSGATDATAPTDGGLPGAGDASGVDASRVTPEGCSGVDPGNTSAANAWPYTLGSTFLGCLRDGSDERYINITTPSNPAGGYVVVTFNNVGQTAIDSFVYLAGATSPGQSVLEMMAGQDGDDLVYWFAAAPMTTYVVTAQDLFGMTFLAPYTFTATYTPVNDPLKPNDNESVATPINLAAPVQSFAFHGYTSDDNMADPGWWSFYQVNFAAAPVTVNMTNVPSEIEMEVYVYGTEAENYSILGYGSSTSNGMSFSFTTSQTPLAGPHYLQVEPAFNPTAYGSGSTPASYVTMPYTIEVTQ